MALTVEEKFKIYSILQMTSSSISMLASSTLIFMIFRSHKKLSTPLHRLLLGLSISDFIASLALSFASTLSPTDHIGWNASGNMTLCRTQAFIHFCSQNASPLYNCSLCIYYLIEIKYTSLQEHLAKIEIFLHVIPVLLPLIAGIAILSADQFQPSSASCSMNAVSPIECQFNPEVECEGGWVEEHKVLSLLWTILSMAIVPLTIFISMTMLYREVSAQEERTSQHRFSFTSRVSSSAYRNKILARNRALSYSLAWLLSWISIFLIVLMRLVLGLESLLPFPMGLVHFSLFPLQGLFNFSAYIFPKLTKRLEHYKREGVAHPKRFLLAFRDSIMSRGQSLLRATRTRSRLVQSRQSLQPNRNSIGSVNLSPEKESHNSQSLFDRSPSPRLGTVEADFEEKKTTEERSNFIEQGAACQLKE